MSVSLARSLNADSTRKENIEVACKAIKILPFAVRRYRALGHSDTVSDS